MVMRNQKTWSTMAIRCFALQDIIPSAAKGGDAFDASLEAGEETYATHHAK
jgi:hypothetical protein